MSRQKQYTRFNFSQRLEHWVAVISFTILAVTGLPQKFLGVSWAESLIAAMGGIESIRVIHRYAAIVLLLETIYHGGAITYKIFVQRVGVSMMLGWQDLKDLLSVLTYNIGLSKTHPKLPRYNFEEKMEYWAFLWGTVLMGITGFMLWNPIATAKFLPGSFIPAAKAAHGGEALLAVLAIIVWHFYGVHLRKFNTSMFNGKLSREAMLHDHALELEEIESGTARPPEPAEVIAKRTKLFIPIAVVISAVMLFGLYMFVTLEETAISTVAAAGNGAEKYSYQPATGSGQRGSIHATITEFESIKDCANSGCHDGGPLESATASTHSQRIAAAGPNPILAHLVDENSSAEGTPDCLICHAKNYQPNDILASVQTVGAAGGQTCARCHSSHPETDVHSEAGLACVSCHTSTHHQMKSELKCTTCHAAQPHSDPILNSQHQRLSCKTCHISTGAAITADMSQPVKDPVTGFFKPGMDVATGPATFGWYKDGQFASIDTEGAKIVPILNITVLAPAQPDPIQFAQTSTFTGDVQETVVSIVPSHGVQKDSARTCDTCHGPEGQFDFLSLGYAEEEADNLSARPPVETE
jgi:cytochrome b subunit of formate dehydrogenase